MSRKYFKPFTFKESLLLIFLSFLSIIFNNDANSEDAAKITGHYYVAKDTSYTKYNDEIQWEITSTNEWAKFMGSLRNMPKDVEKNNPMGLRQPEVIHFNVANRDQKSGHDIFISKAGIQQFSKMPLDVYYEQSASFKDFLETELSINPGYDATNGNVDINAPGIVVIYHGSSHLNNPYWIIKLSEENVMQSYKSHIQNLNRIGISGEGNALVDDNIYENVGTFLLYLNYPDAPQQIMVVGTDSSVRGTKVEHKYYYYKDQMGFFSMFKRQAEDNLRASKAIEKAPEIQRKNEASKGNLF